MGERWKDAGPWLVLLLLPLAAASFRRGLFFVLPLVLLNGLALPRDAAAGWWDDLWQRRDQQAYQALSRDDPAQAAALAVDPELSGEAWYRAGEFANAQQAWSGHGSADTHYNRGNALARLSEYQAALEAYDAALDLEPEMADALHNRAIVEQLLQEQQQQQQQGEQGEQGDAQDGESSQEQQDGESGEDGESQQGEENGDAEQQEGDQQGEPQEGEGEPQEGQQQQDYAEAWSEEDAQAMEQWLRRIPDDPGGLLRRKFRNQHQRRGAPEDESEAW